MQDKDYVRGQRGILPTFLTLASSYSVRFSFTVLRRLFRRLMAALSSGVDHGLVYLPILDLPTCVLAAEIKVLLSLKTRSRREIGSGG